VTHRPFESILVKPACLLLMGIVNWLIVKQPIEIMRSIEIRPDCMIVEGTDVFWLNLIGDNWPTLEPEDDDLDRFTLCGIYGTRFVKYVTSHRVDKSDRTPEVLATHLEDAMEQLWGRTELVFERPLP